MDVREFRHYFASGWRTQKQNNCPACQNHHAREDIHYKNISVRIDLLIPVEGLQEILCFEVMLTLFAVL